ncbi:hypothetical protein GCM10025331_84510 [Actinoplanes utahensis]|nr:hypothetical protein Aut01nite_00310 [Actinoplanes utahensis]
MEATRRSPPHTVTARRARAAEDQYGIARLPLSVIGAGLPWSFRTNQTT